ncbi:MAG: hypothetical protein ABEL76_04460 [Bradymonadaceae bacterium]
MDTLEVLELAEERGGPERRDAMRNLLVTARDLGCRYNVGGGKAGGFNIRYGSLRYAVLDVNTRGEVFLHIKPHPSKGITDEEREQANEVVQAIEGFNIKNGPINHYGQIEEDLEEVPHEAIAEFLEWAVENIRENYYRPHIERHRRRA